MLFKANPRVTSKHEKLLISDTAPNKDSYRRPLLLNYIHFPFCFEVSKPLFLSDKSAACAFVLLYFSPLGKITLNLL